METIQNYLTSLSQVDNLSLLLLGLLLLGIWFMPSLLALFFNRQHAGKIALLNIPAGFSLIVWCALLVWAVTGNLSDKLATKARLKVSKQT